MRSRTAVATPSLPREGFRTADGPFASCRRWCTYAGDLTLQTVQGMLWTFLFMVPVHWYWLDKCQVDSHDLGYTHRKGGTWSGRSEGTRLIDISEHVLTNYMN